MRLSVMSIAFRGQYRTGRMDIADFIRFAHDAGCDGVELTAADESGFEDQVEQALAATGLPVSSYNLRVELLAGEAAARQAAWDQFQQGVARARALDAAGVMLFPAPLDCEDPVAARQLLVTACRRCAEHAAQEGVRLTMENVGSPAGLRLIGQPDHMRQIVEGVDHPAFRLTFDTGNFAMGGQDPLAAFADLAPFVTHVHLKDVAPRNAGNATQYSEVAIGAGMLDFGAFFRALRARAYQGFLSVECAGAGGRAAKEEMISTSVRNTRAFLASA